MPGRILRSVGVPSMTVTVRNRLRTNETVNGANVEIIGQGINGVTNHNGVVSLRIPVDGLHTLRITPVPTMIPILGPIWPNISEEPTPPKRIFSPRSIYLEIASGKVANAINATQFTSTQVTVDLQPLWMKSPNEEARPAGTDITFIIIHHTVTKKIPSNFLNPHAESAHYVINTDGQIVKMVRDSRRAFHAGCSKWGGVAGVNDFSIGIEIVHVNGPYTPAQYEALLGDPSDFFKYPGLLRQLLSAHPGIKERNIVGHEDIATIYNPDKTCNPHFILGNKPFDPGQDFEWEKLEQNHLGLLTDFVGPINPNIYGGFFSKFPAENILLHDNDASKKYDGIIRPTIPIPGSNPPIQELQQDLDAIGYSVDISGTYDEKTEKAVQMLQTHFFSGSRRRLADGKLDGNTADMIKRVRISNP